MNFAGKWIELEIIILSEDNHATLHRPKKAN
uniref:Uncharacterized protein n=1 Tax=Trichinella nativa TaxID=6335 RepID=A0A0V1ILQ0_9BILA